jgi:hypothetical protein
MSGSEIYFALMHQPSRMFCRQGKDTIPWITWVHRSRTRKRLWVTIGDALTSLSLWLKARYQPFQTN